MLGVHPIKDLNKIISEASDCFPRTESPFPIQGKKDVIQFPSGKRANVSTLTLQGVRLLPLLVSSCSTNNQYVSI